MENGFKLIKNFLSEDEVQKIKDITLKFHSKWLEDNKEFYNQKAINSAYLTKKGECSESDRNELFSLISSAKIKEELDQIFIKDEACFLNTQLFFDPKNLAQDNYWHRDIQYTGMSIDEQKSAICEDSNNVVHFRLALRDENGIELIPGTNKRWDTELEYNVRSAENGHNTYDDLPNSKSISLAEGDLLIFSANMIHRGLYGKDRLSLDILFCKPDPDILAFRDQECFPDRTKLITYSNPSVFR